jgi:HK97 family phage major capsid protein
VGDFKRGVLFADRKDLGLRWADNEIYGQYLQAVLRFGVTKVDEKAGYYVTYTPAP